MRKKLNKKESRAEEFIIDLANRVNVTRVYKLKVWLDTIRGYQMRPRTFGAVLLDFQK